MVLRRAAIRSRNRLSPAKMGNGVCSTKESRERCWQEIDRLSNLKQGWWYENAIPSPEVASRIMSKWVDSERWPALPCSTWKVLQFDRKSSLRKKSCSQRNWWDFFCEGMPILCRRCGGLELVPGSRFPQYSENVCLQKDSRLNIEVANKHCDCPQVHRTRHKRHTLSSDAQTRLAADSSSPNSMTSCSTKSSRLRSTTLMFTCEGRTSSVARQNQCTYARSSRYSPVCYFFLIQSSTWELNRASRNPAARKLALTLFTCTHVCTFMNMCIQWIFGHSRSICGIHSKWSLGDSIVNVTPSRLEKLWTLSCRTSLTKNMAESPVIGHELTSVSLTSVALKSIIGLVKRQYGSRWKAIRV